MKGKLRKVIVYLFVLLLASAILNLTPSLISVKADWSPEGSHTYGGANSDSAESIIKCSDGGFAMIGTTRSLDPSNENEAWLIKTDAAGDVEWSQNYGPTASDHGYDLVQTDDDGFVFAGYTVAPGPGDYNAWVVKVDSSGDFQDDYQYGGSGQEYAMSIVKCLDGGFVIAGQSDTDDPYGDILVIKLDSDLDQEWILVYPDMGAGDYDGANSIIQTNDGGYLVAGSTAVAGSGSQFLLLKLTSFGEVAWSFVSGGPDDEGVTDVIETWDGDFVFAGSTYSSASGYDAWLCRVDSTTQVEEWSYTYGGAEDDVFVSVVETSDGGFSLAGSSSSYDVGGIDYGADFWLVKTDSTGFEEWSDTYGGTSNDYARAHIVCSDGSYALAGETLSFGEGANDFYFVKTYGTIMPKSRSAPTFYGWGTSEDRLFCISKTNDGDLYLFGETDWVSPTSLDTYLVKTGPTGVQQWDAIGGWQYNTDYGRGLVATSDGGYAATGTTDSGGLETRDIFLTVGDSDGSSDEWFTFDGETGLDDEGHNIIQTSDGGLVMVGSTIYTLPGTGPHDIWLIKTDPSGHTVEIDETYDNGGDETGVDVVETSDDGFMIAAHSYASGGWYLNLVKTDSEGNQEWNIIIGDPTAYNSPSEIIETSDGGFLITGTTYSETTSYDAWIVKTDSAGDITWEMNYGGPLIDSASGVIETSDGSFMVTGSTQSFGAGGLDAWLMKIDVVTSPGGVTPVIDWMQRYGGTGDDTFSDLVETNNGDFALVGYTTSYGDGDSDGWLVRVGSLFNMGIECNVDGVAPTSNWDYVVRDAVTGDVVDTYTLPGSGGFTGYFELPFGPYLVQQVNKTGYGTLVHGVFPVNEIVEDPSMPYAPDSIVRFYNARYATSTSLDSPDIAIEKDLEPLKPYPVQAAWPVDLEWDGADSTWDLVANKLTTVAVDIPDGLADPSMEYVIKINWEGTIIPSASVMGSTLEDKSTVFIGSLTPLTIGLTWDLAGDVSGEQPGFYSSVSGVETLIEPLVSTEVTVMSTNDLSIYYQTFNKGGSTYDDYTGPYLDSTQEEGTSFLETVYPISSVTPDFKASAFSGTKNILGDLIKLASNAKKNFGGSPAVGLGIVGTDYWSYYFGPGTAAENIAGISWGPSVKAGIVGAGYYSAIAHEIGHTYDLYWGDLEQYEESDYIATGGISTDGFWPGANDYMQGIDFMGLSGFDNDPDWLNWVDSTSWKMLFEKTSQDLTDPHVLFVGGIIYDDGHVEMPVDWTYTIEGFEDVVPSGDYMIQFYDGEGNELDSTYFDAQFYYHVDPGAVIGENGIDTDTNYGLIINTEYAGFAFATEYPDSAETAKIFEVADPENPVELTLYDTSEDPDGEGVLIDEIVPEEYVPGAPEITIVTPTDCSVNPAGMTLDFYATDDDGIASCTGVITNSAGEPFDVLSDVTIDTPGVYNLVVTAEDTLGNTATSDHVLFVVYDPSAGFVTGGGWIDSPEGAYVADPSLAGKATFGFVSKYKKGATVPEGNTEFQFRVANLNFKSASYDWLVVAGKDLALFKGSGTINGEGNYQFIIWAGDGGKTDPDTFRILITDKTNPELVIYDNGWDGGILQEIAGGSIVIHTK